MRLTLLNITAVLTLACLAVALTKSASAQNCIDDDGDGWGWDPVANTSCQVTGNEPATPPKVGGIKVSWAANDTSENVSEYEVAAQVNDSQERTVFRGNATEFTARLSDISINYKDLVCVRIRAVRITSSGSATEQAYSDWSSQSCITLPDAPLRPPQLIELSLIE